MINERVSDLWCRARNLRFLEMVRVMLQKLVGPSYSGSAFFRIADALSRSTIPERLIRLCPVATNQAWAMRAVQMNAIASQVLGEQFTALEIGTWFGEGSTQIWGKFLRPGSRLFLCDPWTRYASESDIKKTPTYSLVDRAHHIAINSTLKRVYEIEKKTGGEVILVRGKSAQVMTYFKAESFDFIYIDGSHYYQDVRRDIELAKTLIRDGGCICGDDLEVDSTPELEAIAEKYLDQDFVSTRMSDGQEVSFHPGVVLAVAREIGTVNRKYGFWWVWRQSNSWTLKPYPLLDKKRQLPSVILIVYCVCAAHGF